MIDFKNREIISKTSGEIFTMNEASQIAYDYARLSTYDWLRGLDCLDKKSDDEVAKMACEIRDRVDDYDESEVEATVEILAKNGMIKIKRV